MKTVIILFIGIFITSLAITIAAVVYDPLRDVKPMSFYSSWRLHLLWSMIAWLLAVGYFVRVHNLPIRDPEIFGLSIIQAVTFVIFNVWTLTAGLLFFLAFLTNVLLYGLVVLRFLARHPCAFHDGDVSYVLCAPGFLLIGNVVIGLTNLNFASQFGDAAGIIITLITYRVFFLIYSFVLLYFLHPLFIRCRYTVAALGTSVVFSTEYLSGLLLAYTYVTPSFEWRMLVFIGYPIYECIRDSLMAPLRMRLMAFDCKSAELARGERFYIQFLQATVCQTLASAAVVFHVATDLVASKYGYATAPTVRCRLACLSSGECLKDCENVMPKRLIWASIILCLDIAGAITTIIANRRFMKGLVDDYFLSDQRGDSGKEKAGFARAEKRQPSIKDAVNFASRSLSLGGLSSARITSTQNSQSMIISSSLDSQGVGSLASQRKTSHKSIRNTISSTLGFMLSGTLHSQHLSGRRGHPYTHLPPRILDFDGNVDRFACYHFWSMRFWMLLVMVAPLPMLYNLQIQALIPTGVTRGFSGIHCRINDAESDDKCYVKVPWFGVEEKIEIQS